MPFTSETGRAVTQARHDRSTPEQRRKGTKDATESRVRAKDVFDRLDSVEDVILAELRAISARLDAIESRSVERIAA